MSPQRHDLKLALRFVARIGVQVTTNEVPWEARPNRTVSWASRRASGGAQTRLRDQTARLPIGEAHRSEQAVDV